MHPSHLYIRYLVIRSKIVGEEVTHKTSHTILNKLGIPSITEGDLEDMTKSIKPPNYIRFFNLSHEPTARYMKSQNVYELWNPDKDDMAFFDLIQAGKARPIDTIKLLLTGGIRPLEIVKRVEVKHGIVTTVRAIELVAKFLWDVDAPGTEEWDYMLRGSMQRGPILASLYGSPDQARYRAGFQPRIEAKSFLKEAFRTMYFRIEGTRYLQDNMDTSNIVSRYSKELSNLYTAIYGEGAGLEDILREFKGFLMKTKNPIVKDINELAPKGNFSGSGVKYLEPKKEQVYELDADSGVGTGSESKKADA